MLFARTRRAVAIGMALAAFGAVEVQAQSSVGTRAGIGETDLVDWGVLGPPFTNITSPFALALSGGTNMSVSTVNGNNFERRDQSTGGWAGDFNPGERLLWTQGTNGPLTFAFNQAISAFGFNIQADFFGAFTAVMTAFDGVGNVLFSFAQNGVSTSNADGSAMFMGIEASGIRKVEVSVPIGVVPQDFAVNRLSVNVPEPTTMLLLGTSLLGLCMAGVRRRRTDLLEGCV